MIFTSYDIVFVSSLGLMNSTLRLNPIFKNVLINVKDRAYVSKIMIMIFYNFLLKATPFL